MRAAKAQKNGFDYGIKSVLMYEIDQQSDERKQIVNLEAYLYDIGPQPHFEFEITVEQITSPSWQAKKVDIVVERYALLKTNENAIYNGLDSIHPDAGDSTFWTYHGPVQITFTRSANKNNNEVTLTSNPYQFSFLDPKNPITFARPLNYTILGYAFRFSLQPSSIQEKDTDLSNNAYQLTFLKP